jgi:hypothetical protein
MAIEGLSLVDKQQISFQAISSSLAKLARVYPLLKPVILKACAASIKADKQITPVEAEFLQMVAATLDCPVSPLYAGQLVD